MQTNVSLILFKKGIGNMKTHTYISYGHSVEGVLPDEWNYFGLYLCLSIVCLLLAARLAKVSILSFPVNPLYWHYWVVANAKLWPYIDKEKPNHGFQAYMYLWAISVLFLIYAFFILIKIVNSIS